MTVRADAAPEPRAPGREEIAVRLAAGLLVAFALWRATQGADLSDDGHVTALALRLSRGDEPFVDEMNIQALGSLPAVPFTWAWTALFGTSGLVLASRVFFVCAAALAAWIAYRALRTGFRPSIAAVGASAPLLAPAYNLLVVSYNTVPLLALVVGAAAGFAAIRTRRWAWGAVSSGAIALGITCYPPMVVAGSLLLLLVLVLSRSRPVALGVIAAGAAVAVPAALWFLWGIGVPAIQATLDHTNSFLAARLTARERLELSTTFYGDNLWRRRYWPAWGLAILASIPRLPARLHATLVCGIPVLVVAGSLLSFTEDTPAPFGRVTAVSAVVITATLLVPVVVFAIGNARGDLGQLLTLALPGSLVQAGVVLLTTSSGPAWGIPYIGLAPLFLAVTVGWLSIVERGHRLAPAVAGASLVVALALLLALKPFKDPYPWELGGRIASGAFAGVSTTSTTVAGIGETTRSIEATVRPDQGLLIYGNPGAYLLTEARPVTPLLWLVNNGKANQFAVDYLESRGERPDVVLVHENQVHSAGGWAGLEAQDPLIAWLRTAYETRPDQSGPFYVLTPRQGASTPTG